MHLTCAGLVVFILTALPLLVFGRAIGTEMLVLGGGLFALMLFMAVVSAALLRKARQGLRQR